MLVRHGETEWSSTGKHAGRTEIPLTDRGRRQAEALRTPMAGWRFAAALTSPLQHAAETGRLADLQGVTVEVEADLQEWHYGKHEGRTTPEIREDDPAWTVWRGPIPGANRSPRWGSPGRQVIARIETVGGDVAVFSHGHLLRMLAARWMGLDPAEGVRLMLGTATLSVLGSEHGTRAIRLWNGLPPTPVD